jgi:hypothetical protein
MPPRRKRRPTPDPETNTPPTHALRDPQRAPPEAVTGGKRRGQDPRSRAEAMGVDEYERELDRLDAATSTRH